MDLDDPRTTVLRRRAIRENTFLSQIYDDWYGRIVASIPSGPGGVVELGSGAGFLRERLPGLITTETFHLDGMSLIVDGRRMPFTDGALKAVAMTNVLHHIPEVRQFFTEVTRVVRPGGVVSMIEPWVSDWSRFIYARLHHEPFDPTADSWEFASVGPLSSANGALPWIIFGRDRIQFEQEFREWHVVRITPFMPLAYLLSGGVSMRQLMPAWSYRAVRGFETALTPVMSHLAMFAHVVMVKRADAYAD
ncbi:MAG: methyltransferase domain-containing protein [Thermoanaerobaculia bacterium]|nr:methyltransferase domain-containing protein [Thermoanaerobaculia bacterium]